MKLTFRLKLILFFILYLVFRLAIFNINSAEWGDSYRILRATSFLEKSSYPSDEKRPPLYSAFLTLIPNNLDPVYGGRLLMVIVSLVTVYFFYLLLNTVNFKFTDNQKFFALILFAFNPLYVYWSMRIYADTFFLMICLASILLYYSLIKNNSTFKIVCLSFVSFLGIMTRFEGYILVASIFLAFIFEFFRKRDSKILINLFLYSFIGFSLFFLAINTPWTYFKNPISSSYVDEANRRVVGVFDVLGFALSVIFLLGNFFTLYFIFFDKLRLFKFIQENFILSIFLVIELVLAFAWPAAVPRLLVQIVPIVVVLMLVGMTSFYESKKVPYFLIFPLGLVIYVIGQFLIKSQFLLTNYYFMFVLILIALIQIYYIFKQKPFYLELSLILSTILWMLLFVYLHKDIYKVLNSGVAYFNSRYQGEGIIVTNDVSYLTKFYFADNLKYLRQIDFGNITESSLKERNARYLIVTNEHNPDMKYTPSKYDFLETIYEYREEVNGREFFVVISKVNIK